MVGDAVEQGAGEALAGEQRCPFLEGQVGGDDRGAVLVAPAEDVEQQLAAGLRQRDVSEFVDDQETDLGDLGLGAEQSLLVAQALEDPLRRVPLLARHLRVCVRLEDRADEAGDPVQLGPPHRLRPAIARRRRIAQHRLHRPAVDAEPPRRLAWSIIAPPLTYGTDVATTAQDKMIKK